MESSSALRLRGVWQGFGRGRHRLEVLCGLDLEIGTGTHTALTGDSGTGKSTLLAVLGGIQRPRAGRVEVAGRDLMTLDGGRLAEFRRQSVGFVFQHSGLVEVLTAQENVELAMALARAPRRGRPARARRLLQAVGLGGRLQHRPSRLSGGERQRVAVARALANRPSVVLADEPTGSLDPQAAELVLESLERLRSESGCTLVVVTHNPAVAARADSRLVLAGGRVESR